WSAAQKAQIVRESLEPGAVVAVVAHRHDLHPKLLHHWRRRARQAASGEVNFVPVSIAVSSKPSTVVGGTIEIELGGGVRVRVDANIDEGALGRVLRALGR
ncbi:MAG: transposase, partial [Gammaproteobacteria bacterium]|nr:transposase [Gammaproteobacteria bacterium]